MKKSLISITFKQRRRVMKKLIILIVFITLSFSLTLGQVKYKCPNGCEGATFSYMHSSSTLMYWPQWTIDEQGNKTYHKNPNIITNYYKCSKCNKKFTELELLNTAKAYGDSVISVESDAKYDTTDIVSEEYKHFPFDSLKCDTIRVILTDAHIYKSPLQIRIDSLEKRIEELEEILEGKFLIETIPDNFYPQGFYKHYEENKY